MDRLNDIESFIVALYSIINIFCVVALSLSFFSSSDIKKEICRFVFLAFAILIGYTDIQLYLADYLIPSIMMLLLNVSIARIGFIYLD